MTQEGGRDKESGTLTTLHENGLSLAISDILFNSAESKCVFFHYFICIYSKKDLVKIFY